MSQPLAAAELPIRNPSQRSYENEPIRLPVAMPDKVGRVTLDGTPLPHAVVDGQLWTAVSLKGLQSARLQIETGTAKPGQPLVQLTRGSEHIEVSNGLIAARLPAQLDRLRPPITSLRWTEGPWIGAGAWHSERKFDQGTVEVIADGTVFAAVRYTYHFSGQGGTFAEEPARYVITVSCLPGRSHLDVQEDLRLDRTSSWSFDLAAGWSGRQVRAEAYGLGMGMQQQFLDYAAEKKLGIEHWPPTDLSATQSHHGPVTFRLLPRWNQDYADGWLFLLHNGTHGVGVIPTAAIDWTWPHDATIQIETEAATPLARVRLPLWHGSRRWFLYAGDAGIFLGDKAQYSYATRYVFEPLDKLLWDFALTMPADEKKPEQAAFRARNIWDDSSINPTSGLRRQGREALADAGKPGGFGQLSHGQWMLHPDTFGTYWQHWSPENPNFFTDLVTVGIGELARLRQHPAFPQLRRLVESVVRQDIYHSVTMPGGAGQECPGYQAHALHLWEELAPVLKEHYGLDLASWPRVQESYRFLAKLSQPNGPRRLFHPGGDTHPGKPDPVRLAAEHGIEVEVSSLQTEELPGFGAVFRHAPGTANESYLAFKSGPNRGHYHGDQLSFHYCAQAHPAAVDHHCSYKPRADQEHMHNRVAFHTKAMPYANMDGYERLIAFQAKEHAAAAVGQVESDRLRPVLQLPPDRWGWNLGTHTFTIPLRYRRSIVHVRPASADGLDYFVIRDQYQGPEVSGTYCLHGLGTEARVDGQHIDFPAFRASIVQPQPAAISWLDWQHDNGGLEATKGLRITQSGTDFEFVTVLSPRRARSAAVARINCGEIAIQVDKKDANKRSATPLTILAEVDPDSLQLVAAQVLAPAFSKTATIPARIDGKYLIAELPGGRRHLPAELRLQLHLQRAADGLAGRLSGTCGEQAVEGPVTGSLRRDAPTMQPDYLDTAFPAISSPGPGQVQIGEDLIRFSGGFDPAAKEVVIQVSRSGKELLQVHGSDLNLQRSQGEIGLFVPDAGYRFGPIPDWLLRQRATPRPPEWHLPWQPLGWGSKDAQVQP